MLMYSVKSGVIMALLHFIPVIGFMIFEDKRLDAGILLVGIMILFFYSVISKKKMDKIACPDINVIKEMNVKNVPVEYKPGKFNSALKFVSSIYYLGCFVPMVNYWGSEILIYFVEQPDGTFSKISDDRVVLLWAFLMVIFSSMPAIYGKIKEANIIFNTEDVEERYLRNGLAWEVTRNAQKLKLLLDLERLGR